MAKGFCKAFMAGISFLLAACGGGATDGAQQSAISKGEINTDNALLVISIADRAVARYISYKALTSKISSYLAYSPPIPSSIPCGGTAADGRLSGQTLSATEFNITLESCVTNSGIILKSGTVGISNFSRTNAGASVVFTSVPNGAQITDYSGTDTITGNVSYDFKLSSSDTSSSQTNIYKHSGQLDFQRSGKTDQYRNLAITWSEPSGVQTPSVALNISSLEIFTPRVSVAKLVVTTPSPMNADSQSNSMSGSLSAASSKDGSRVQYDFLSSTSARLRLWDSDGVLVFDKTKNSTDADVIAAENSAAN